MHFRPKPNGTVPRPSPPEWRPPYTVPADFQDAIARQMPIHATAGPVSGRCCGRNHTDSGAPCGRGAGVRASAVPSRPGPPFRIGAICRTDPMQIVAKERSAGAPCGAHRSRDAAAHVTPHRDTHPQLLWETLLICRPERPQRTERTLFPSHCTTYVHFPYAPIFITIQIVNRINGVPAASICLKHSRRPRRVGISPPPDPGVRHTASGTGKERTGKGFAPPSDRGRPDAGHFPLGERTGFDAVPIAPA